MNPVVDPAREKVERGDEAVRESLEAVIDDPTVFVKGAALGALTGIALAKLAATRSRRPDIRAFAERMRRDQDAIRKELATLSARKALDVPTTLVYEDERRLAAAPDAPGEAFERWFVRSARDEHFKATALFAAAARMKDADLAAFAGRALAVLEADRDSVVALAAD